MSKDWFSPYNALNSKEGIIWMLENLIELKLGGWWANPDKPIVQIKGDITEAHFEQVAIIMAELEMRLDLTGRDGDMAITVHCNKVPFDKLANMMGLDYWDVVRRVNNALNYSVGKRRRTWSYREFVNRRKNRT